MEITQGDTHVVNFFIFFFPLKKNHKIDHRFPPWGFSKKKINLCLKCAKYEKRVHRVEDNLRLYTLCRVFSTVVLGGMTCHPRFLGWFLGGIYATQDFLFFFECCMTCDPTMESTWLAELLELPAPTQQTPSPSQLPSRTVHHLHKPQKIGQK